MVYYSPLLSSQSLFQRLFQTSYSLESKKKNNVSLTIEENYESIYEYDGIQKLLRVNDGIKEIDENAFCQLLVMFVHIPDSVEIIGPCAFYHCQHLEVIELSSSSLRVIGYKAFGHCPSLSNLQLPHTITHIGKRAFYRCKSLQSMTIPNSIEKIENGTFAKCTLLESIHLPSSIQEIDDDAFDQCSSLQSDDVQLSSTEKESIIISEPKQCHSIFKNLSLLTRIGHRAFTSCKTLVSIELPSSLREIGNNAFSHCSMLSIVRLPSTIVHIGQSAFSFCISLKSINIPSSIKKIEARTFEGCISLISIHLPSTIEEIGNSAFRGCNSLESIHEISLTPSPTYSPIIFSSLTTIGNMAFDNCTSLASIDLPSSLNRVGESSFSNCVSLSSITLPSFVDRIAVPKFCDYDIFLNCNSVERIMIESSIEHINRNVVDFLVYDIVFQNPELAKTPFTADSCLPLHLILMFGRPSFYNYRVPGRTNCAEFSTIILALLYGRTSTYASLIGTLVRAAPSSLAVCDPFYNMYPFLLAACTPRCVEPDLSTLQPQDLDTIYMLLREAPWVMDILLSKMRNGNS